MHTLIALLVSLIISHTGLSYESLPLCNGITINNIDRAAVTELSDLWFVSLDNGQDILVFNSCESDYRAYSVSDFSRIEF